MLKDFQRMASEQGAAFHGECIRALQMAGFEIADEKLKIKDLGIELDAVTTNAHDISMPWEFKGSWNGNRPGLWRTDTLRKAIASGYLLSRWSNAGIFTPLLVMTTHNPLNVGGSPRAMLCHVERSVILDVLDTRDQKRLRWFFNATEEDLVRLRDETPWVKVKRHTAQQLPLAAD